MNKRRVMGELWLGQSASYGMDSWRLILELCGGWRVMVRAGGDLYLGQATRYFRVM